MEHLRVGDVVRVVQSIRTPTTTYDKGELAEIEYIEQHSTIEPYVRLKGMNSEGSVSSTLVERVLSENYPEDSGGSCDYYKVPIKNPTTASEPYVAECNDVIEELNMTYAEANMFKEIWRSAAARTLGKLKAGHNEQRGAEKIVFFAERNAIQKGVK